MDLCLTPVSPYIPLPLPCLHGNQLLSSLQEDGRGGSRLQWTTTPSHPPWLWGQCRGRGQMGSHPIHPRPSATFPISSWGPESVEEEGQEWDGAEGGGPQLPQLPPFKPPLSQILPLADLGRKKKSLETRNSGRRKSSCIRQNRILAMIHSQEGPSTYSDFGL